MKKTAGGNPAGTGSQPGRGERAEPDGKGHVLDEDQGKTGDG